MLEHDSVFDRLSESRNESKTAQQQQLEIAQEQRERMMQYFRDLFGRNSTMSVQVPSVVVHGATRTRDEFMQDQLAPILDRSVHTVGSLIQAVDKVYSDLASFAIYDKIQINLVDQPTSIFTSSNVLSVKPMIYLQPAKRFVARTGTDVGNGEGNGYANFTFRNVFGGAEMLSLDATIGTRTRSSYLVNLNSPINHSAKWRGELIGFATSRSVPYASHDQILRGLTTKVKSSNQELAFESVWRTVSANQDYVSQTVREQAGDSIKGAISHTWSIDKRDSSLLPSSGYFFKTSQEIAGLLGETPYIKGSFESQCAVASPSKFFSATMGLRGGMLWMADNKVSHLMDRFYLGGPNDVRGFSLGTIGPQDDGDSVGGDAFMAAGVSLFSKLPRLSPDSPLRAQFFVNGGSVLPLDQQDVQGTYREIVTRPSVAMGLGLLYNHPVARFELNFTLPITARQHEGVRKGLQFGVGFSFL